MKKYDPINPKAPQFLHGGDYNPDQWLNMPSIIDEDMRLIKLANCNAMSIGIFSWTTLEPEEGKFNFEWLDDIMDKLHKNDAFAVLATPTGARPAWMSQKYPEVLRVAPNRIRNLHGRRHNHCYTSPVYREKAKVINTKLAERYKSHPALLIWHISNEYGGECHCDLCQNAFIEWLREKYNHDLDALNKAWWTKFWSHTYTAWDQIESPAPHGELYVHGLNLDWKRFVTHQTIDFMKNELEPLKRITPGIPATTNFMGTYKGLNYFKFAPYLDVISWDSYPQWHVDKKEYLLGSDIAFVHDLNRSLKGGKPFMLMESTPSMTNWQKIAKLKRPGMHILSSLQAVAHGSDTVQYFQWRKSRGSSEKFHGAVVDHCGHENTRVFNEVSKLGEILKQLRPVIGSTVDAEVAIIYDWENAWAIDDMQGLRKEGRDYEATCKMHYKAFWDLSIPVDIVDMESDISKYKLVIAPMLYMIRGGIDKKIESFAKNGGTFVATYWSGIVDENDLCFLGGFPGPLRNVLGIWSEEIDSLHNSETTGIQMIEGNPLGIESDFEACQLCDLIHSESASILAQYKDDFYKCRPALTVNAFGKGKAYYIAFRSKMDFLTRFYTTIAGSLKIKKAIDVELPLGISAQVRTDGIKEYVFIMNFTNEIQEINIGKKEYYDFITRSTINNKLSLESFGVAVLEKTTNP